MKRRGPLMLVLLVAVALLATLVVSAAMTGVAEAQSQTIQVGGSSSWTDTGFSVTAGETLAMTATGTIYFRRDNKLGEVPDGGACAVPQSRFTASTFSCYSLIGKVGTSGTPFEVGASYSDVFQSSGELYLLANDNVGAFGNNTGSWTVAISDTITVVTTAAVSAPTTVAPVVIRAVTPAVTTPSTSLAFTGLGEGFQILALVGLILLLLGTAIYFCAGYFFGGELRSMALWLMRR